ncbi:uncharacterized protein LOC124774869 [Schistocerca piceifrons]|uniref:uncharacterized protein LOC124774869 n=1 Tax=Schistocerca piceifrons TaxID=274613 RepID=UPI001F5F98C6|nr:uncharacterized protein LOC124774869 [Schistocerca piceifrons]XP_047105473.1 uncharacterized protein LOC124774869 [Schistocerca piceifrons]
MTDPSSEDDGVLREWAPLEDLLQQIPLKAQRGLFTHELSLTCVDILPEYIAVGTNLGLVYWYGRRNRDLQRLRCENTAASVTCVKVISTVDYMVAAGNDQGSVTVFQIPKSPPDNLPESMKPKRNKQVERYTISGLHTSAVTAIEWSMNGMKLFSGDKNGLVVLTEIDFYMHLSKSVELLNEKYEIVQLSYSQQLLLVSTLYRSILCHRDDRWKVVQVGQKERKMLGHLGATLSPGTGRPQDLIIYASRPGLRIWLADRNGVVQQTLIYKDALSDHHPEVPLINPLPERLRTVRGDPQFGPVRQFHGNLLVTYSPDSIYILDPSNISVVGTVSGLRGVLDVSVSRDEIFVLEGGRSLIRLAYGPEAPPAPSELQGYRQENQQDPTFMSIPVSLTDNTVTLTLRGFTSKFKGSTIVPAIPFNKFGLFNRFDGSNEPIEHEDINPIITADEAMELPPIIAMPTDDLVELNVERKPLHSESSKIDENKIYKEYFNRAQRGSLNNHRGSNVSLDSSRAEILEKIGEQQFEDILFKPKHGKNKSRKVAKNKHLSGLESGSDSMSTSTNSIRSVNSDSEEAGSSEQVSGSTDCASTPTRCIDPSSSEDTLVRLSDCVVSEKTEVVNVNGLISDSSRKLGEITLSHNSEEKDCIIPHIKPDLRSPGSIERDVADKEKRLAKFLNLDTLYKDASADPEDPVANGELSECVTNENSNRDLESPKPQEDACHDVIADYKCPTDYTSNSTKDCEYSNSVEVSDEKLSSYNSVLSYGPPSGSSAPPSVHTSLDTYSPGQQSDTVVTEISPIERGDKWVQFKTPCPITSLSVCSHYVCCIDSRDFVFFSNFSRLGLKWQKLDNKARQVVMSQNGDLVWKLYKNTAYALKQPSYKGPFGTQWLEAAKDVQCIAVSESAAWTVSLDGRVYIHKYVTRERPFSTPEQVPCVYMATRICCFRERVWILTTTGEVLWRSHICEKTPEGRKWNKVEVHNVVDIALGCHETGWLIDSKNTILFSDDFTEPKPSWWQVLVSDYVFQETTPLEQFRNKLTDNYLCNLRPQCTVIVACGEDTLWISEKMATYVYMNKTEFTGHQWNGVNVRLLYPAIKWQMVSAEGIHEDKGQLWLFSRDGNLYCSSPDLHNLQPVELPSTSQVVCLAATLRAAWLLTAQGEVFIRQGLSDTCHNGYNWKRLDLSQIDNVRFTHVSCGRDVIWACDAQGDIYMAFGIPQSVSSSTFSPAWIPTDERTHTKIHFVKVYVGPVADMVWAIDVRRKVYIRKDILPDFPLGSGWVLVSGIDAVALSISGTAVWALDPGGSVYRRYGISPSNYVGDYWKRIPGAVSALTASVNDDLWAIEKKGSLLRHRPKTVKLSLQPQESKSQDSQVAPDEDWEVI